MVIILSKYFGTDGFRGEFNKTLNCDHALKIGRFLGSFYNGKKILIGRDTRISGPLLADALIKGIIEGGAIPFDAKIVPTAAISYLVKKEDYVCGIMISASHNPYYDNGIKIMDEFGNKANDELLLKIESYIDNELDIWLYGINKEIKNNDININEYVKYLNKLLLNNKLNVGFDLANGSAYQVAKEIFVGDNYKFISDNPNGENINYKCGSTNMDNIANFVKENKLDIGFSFDGDSDRCLFCDSLGNIYSGDHILYILTKYLKSKNKLNNDKIVTTVMSNIGLYKALDKLNIKYEKTNVGDKYVYECMNKYNLSLGGEQSGHIIINEYLHTGDGILTAIMILNALNELNISLNDILKDLIIYPQILININVKDKNKIMENKPLYNLIDKLEKSLNNDGRILVRKSGTENLIRVMVEASDINICKNIANKIADYIKQVD